MDAFEKLLEECDKNISFYTSYLEKLRKGIGLLDDAKAFLNKTPAKTDFKDFTEIEQFTNYVGYFTIAILDLSVNLKNLIKAKTDWEKIFFIKNSYLIIHETINNLKPSKGKSFVELTIEKHYPDLKESLKGLLEDIEYFKKATDYKKIETARHNTAGHIQKSLKKYFDTIHSLDGKEAGSFINQFLKILSKALFLTKDYAVLSNKNLDEKSADLHTKLNALLDKIQKTGGK